MELQLDLNSPTWMSAIDPELQASLSKLPTIDLDDVSGFRRAVDTPGVFPAELREMVDSTDTAVGARCVRVRTYRPKSIRFTAPVVYLHAGGYVAGSLTSAERWARQLCLETGAVITSVDYSLAPEDPYPAALHDVVSVIQELSERSGEPVAVIGDSAGAGLGAAAALQLRDQGHSPVGYLSLTNPAIDDRMNSDSATKYVDTPLWSKGTAQASWTLYLRGTASPGADDVPPYAAPARAEDLRGMPPTFVAAAHLDPLRDEAIEFSQKLLASGIPTELHLYPGTFHGSRTISNARVSQLMACDTVQSLKLALIKMTQSSIHSSSNV